MTKKNENVPESSEQEASLMSSDALHNWDDVDADYERLFGNLSNEEKPKKGKKKKESTEIQPESNINFNPDDIKIIACMPLNAWYRIRKWRLMSEEEEKTWSECVAKVADKYMPMLLQYSVELSLITHLGTQILSRIDWSKQNVKQTIQQNDSNIGTTGNGENELDIQKPIII